ncbi:M1 family metallopeptidase [Reichenbachiella sp. MALMAid0571]|uniref:M1 family metallopeptidase n=1 Tax=Reichenbachiella sp. MALMAid0571 TaxID=3143939 RepID=UPI0032DF9FE7
MNKLFGLIILAVLLSDIKPITAQDHQYTRQDSLRGSITPERIWWDLTYYHLDLKVDIDNKFIFGKNSVYYKVLTPNQVIQIDLQPPMKIDKVLQNGKELTVRHETNAHFIELSEVQREGAQMELDIYYSGNPIEAKNAPWDGGIVWSRDKKGNPFVASACQGIGASVWWPCKDHSYDEPDSMLISTTVPETLTNVSNGRLRKVDENVDGTKTYHWFVSNPINNYGVNINIGNYVHFSEKYTGEKGSLDMDFYVLKYNLKKAQKQFTQAAMTIEALEYWFGPYPFYEDGYKLVEVPYLGMEHQSSVTYGNGYSNGYRGRDLSSSGWGMKFDFIIVHESGHEWFANNITNIDVADMWIHESFTSYSENLFLDYHYGKKASSEYVIGTRLNIVNDEPIIADYGVNQRSSIDIYYKGSNILHTLRQIIDNDEKWRQILRGLNKEFYHQTVSTRQVENFISQQVGINLKSFFDQYLRDSRMPVLEYFIRNNELNARWTNCLGEFDMSLKIKSNGKEHWIKPTTQWQVMKLDEKTESIRIDSNFYVGSMNVLGNSKD